MTEPLIIPNSVEYIEPRVFVSCSSFETFLGCSEFKGELKIPNSITVICNGEFISYSGFSGDLVIPDSVVFIGSYVFEYCLEIRGSLIIGNSLKEILDAKNLQVH